MDVVEMLFEEGLEFRAIRQPSANGPNGSPARNIGQSLGILISPAAFREVNDLLAQQVQEAGEGLDIGLLVGPRQAPRGE